MALKMVSSLRIATMEATFFGLPAAHRGRYNVRMTGLYWVTVKVVIYRAVRGLP